MEAIGQVNRYTPRLTTDQQKRRVAIPPPFFVLNLCNGTTPFVHFQPWGRSREVYEYHSCFYRLLPPAMKLDVTYGHYRPSVEVFNTLTVEEQEFILEGALLMAPLSQAIDRQLAGDQVRPEWEHARYRQYMVDTYGRAAKRSFDPPT